MKTAHKYINTVINGLTILEFSHSKQYTTRSRHHFFKYRCHCGNEKIGNLYDIKRGSTTSCGCRRVNEAIEKEAGLKSLYHIYKKGAQKRNYSFELSIDEFKLLTSQNCSYCGRAPHRFRKSWSEHSVYTYNGVDRRDNTLGYVLENCVPCCSICNRAKSDLPYEEFIEWIQAVRSCESCAG